MILSRRDFLNLCKASSAAFGLTALNVIQLQELLAQPGAPTILWLQGSACTGCSVSFLNYVSPTPPSDVPDLLINHVNLAYHNTVMSADGQFGVAAVEAAYAKGGYVLAVEGGVPTAFGGHTCLAWTAGGQDVTFRDAVARLSSRAAAILCVGTCSSYGGIASAPPNPTGVLGVAGATGRKTINIAGCPPHPDWIVWAIANLLLGTVGELDDKGRPKQLYARAVHERCPRKEARPASTYGQDRQCLKKMGCAGPRARGNCPVIGWNDHSNWCADANAQCIACTEPDFCRSTLRRLEA